MQGTFNLGDIRGGLRAKETDALQRAIVAVGKIETAELREDVADEVLRLFSHSDPGIRTEAVRALGVHWRLLRAINGLVAALEQDPDEQVRLSAISGLGALGSEHADIACSVGKTLASAVLNEGFSDYERMVAYIELQQVEGKITFEEGIASDGAIPGSLATFEIDWPWIRELRQRKCPPR
jgi:HEAT repeat protein